MTATMMVSYIILWALVIVLSLLVFALARQVGVLHERVAPAGALMLSGGPKVGELTEKMMLTDLLGNPLSVGGVDSTGLATLVLFISPTCPVCKSLVPIAQSLSSHESGRLRLVFASDGDNNARHEAYVRDLGVVDYPYVVSESLGLAYSVSKLPFALLIGKDGELKSKGLVNSREHLESLVEAMDSGIATLQDYVRQFSPEGDEAVESSRS